MLMDSGLLWKANRVTQPLGRATFHLSLFRAKLRHAIAQSYEVILCTHSNRPQLHSSFKPSGASLVQLYTALAYGGPGVIPSMKAELARLLERDGFTSVAAAVGADHGEGKRYGESKQQAKQGWWKR